VPDGQSLRIALALARISVAAVPSEISNWTGRLDPTSLSAKRLIVMSSASRSDAVRAVDGSASVPGA
jgi:hypothetical protein